MKSSLLKLAIAATAFGAASFANASDWEVGVAVPYYSFDDELNAENATGVSLFAGHRFNKPFGIELTGTQLTVEDKDSTAEFDATDIRLDGLWYIHNEGRVLPYAALGASLLQYDVDGADDEEAISLGLGAKAHLMDRLRARFEIRLMNNLDSHQTHDIVTLGLGYVFGASDSSPAPVAVAFVDADQDGVEDSSDMCADTPSGVNVDAKGCALDTDKDGVADHADQCAETDRKLKVDEAGCPVVLSEDVSIDLNVKFASGSDVVDAQYFAEIRGVARFMEQYEGSQVTIEGHTDTSGSASYNKKLSQKRADAVAALLVEQYSIDASRVTAMGYGEERPLVEETSKADQATNRRVVAKVSATKESMEEK